MPSEAFSEAIRGLVWVHDEEVAFLRQQVALLRAQTHYHVDDSEGSMPPIPSSDFLFGSNTTEGKLDVNKEIKEVAGGPHPTLETKASSDIVTRALDLSQPRPLPPPLTPPKPHPHLAEHQQNLSQERIKSLSKTASRLCEQIKEQESHWHESLEHSHVSEDRSSSKKTGRALGNIRLEKSSKSRLEIFADRDLDVFVGLVILANSAMLFLALQDSGLRIGIETGFQQARVWDGAPLLFETLEHVFQAIYVSEIIFRIIVLKKAFWYNEQELKWEKFNIFDIFVVVLGCMDMYVLAIFDTKTVPLARVIRLARLSRTLKVVRVLQQFSKLRVLVCTVANSLMAFIWSMALLFVFMFLASCMITQQLQPLILTGDLEDQVREDMWRMYGTTQRAFWTMFEITLGGQGTSMARVVVEHYWAYSLFFYLYISGVSFAVISIIQALFLKDTLDLLALDANMMVQEKMEMKKKTTEMLEDLFKAVDLSDDGYISLHEFEEILEIPQARGFMELLDLEVSEARTVFELLDDGDGMVSYAEFSSGVMRLKGQARAMDVIASMRDIRHLQNMILDVENLLLGYNKKRDLRRLRTAQEENEERAAMRNGLNSSTGSSPSRS